MPIGFDLDGNGVVTLMDDLKGHHIEGINHHPAWNAEQRPRHRFLPSRSLSATG